MFNSYFDITRGYIPLKSPCCWLNPKKKTSFSHGFSYGFPMVFHHCLYVFLWFSYWKILLKLGAGRCVRCVSWRRWWTVGVGRWMWVVFQWVAREGPNEKCEKSRENVGTYIGNMWEIYVENICEKYRENVGKYIGTIENIENICETYIGNIQGQYRKKLWNSYDMFINFAAKWRRFPAMIHWSSRSD